MPNCFYNTDQCSATHCQEIVRFIGSLLECITDSIQASHVTVIESGLANVLLDVIHVFTSEQEVTQVSFNYFVFVYLCTYNYYTHMHVHVRTRIHTHCDMLYK